MHYVQKNQIMDLLVANADDFRNELYRAQEIVSSIDQNNLAQAGGQLWPGEPGANPVSILSGVSFDTVPVPSTDTHPDNARSMTRWHFKHAAAGTNVTETGVWTSQVGAEINFRVYETAAYLLFGSCQVEADDVLGFNPLIADLGFVLNGEVQEPYTTRSVGTTFGVTLARNNLAPLFWQGSAVLYPGEWNARLVVRQRPGVSLVTTMLNIGALGFIR